MMEMHAPGQQRWTPDTRRCSPRSRPRLLALQPLRVPGLRVRVARARVAPVLPARGCSRTTTAAGGRCCRGCSPPCSSSSSRSFDRRSSPRRFGCSTAERFGCCSCSCTTFPSFCAITTSASATSSRPTASRCATWCSARSRGTCDSPIRSPRTSRWTYSRRYRNPRTSSPDDADAAFRSSQLRADLDAYLKTRASPELCRRRCARGSPWTHARPRRRGPSYNVPLLNAVVLYVGVQAIAGEPQGRGRAP